MRETRFNQCKAMEKRLSILSSLYQNPMFVSDEIKQEAIANLDELQTEFLAQIEIAKKYLDTITLTENTYKGKLCILAEKINEVANEKFREGKIGTGKLFEDRCRTIHDFVVSAEEEPNGTILNIIDKHKDLCEFFSKMPEDLSTADKLSIQQEVRKKEIQEKKQVNNTKSLNEIYKDRTKSAFVCGVGFDYLYGDNIKGPNYSKLLQKINTLLYKCVTNKINHYWIVADKGSNFLTLLVLLQLKKKFTQIKLHVIIPHYTSLSDWDEAYRKQFMQVITTCDEIIELDKLPKYSTMDKITLKLEAYKYASDRADYGIVCKDELMPSVLIKTLEDAFNKCKSIYNVNPKTFNIIELTNI